MTHYDLYCNALDNAYSQMYCAHPGPLRAVRTYLDPPPYYLLCTNTDPINITHLLPTIPYSYFSWRKKRIYQWHLLNNKKRTTLHYFLLLKYVYSEKATKFYEIFALLLSTVHTNKSKVKISQNFVAFSDYMNFNKSKRSVAVL